MMVTDFDWRGRAKTPADGWSLNVGPIPAGNGDGEGGFVMSGGLTIAFDTYDNGNDSPSIEVFANGISVGNYPRTFSYSSTTSRNLVVHWDNAGLDVTYDGAAVCTNLATPGYIPAAGHSFAFCARTGGATQTTQIDNLLITTVAQSPLDTGGPLISEFCADNENGIEDENGDRSDWIEIYNGSATPANLSGWFLTDTPSLPNRWALPNVTVPAYGYLTVWASGKNRIDPAYPLHTNFSLSKTAGYLALMKPDNSAASEFTYGGQAADVSYGLLANGTGGYDYGYLETPTPGTTNLGLQAAGPPAEDVVFLKDGVATTGGLFSTAFTLSIQEPLLAGSVVRYTTNNTPPTETSPIYTTPISVSATTTVRARVFSPGRLPGAISSRTFLALDSTLTNYHGSGQAFSSNLPIIVMDSYGVPIDSYTTEGARPHRLTYSVVIDKNAAAPAPDTNRAVITGVADFQGRCGTHVRGETSAGFPQKSYSWELWNNDNEDKSASILGFPAESDWVLHAPYTDKTLMRNFVVFSMMRAFDGNASGMGVKFVEVFFNQDGGALTESDYRGVYVLVEKIKRGGDRVNIEKLTDTMTDPAMISGGYIFARDKSDPGDVVFPTTLINSTTTAPLGGDAVSGFTFVEPDAPNAAQKTWLTNHMNAFEAALTGSNFADPGTGYAAYINPRSFVDNQWFIEITKQIDGYRWSSYFYKDRNGKINSGPVWDYNLSLYNANYNQGDSHEGWYYSVLHPAAYYYWPRLHQDPNYEILHWDRYWDLRRGLFESTSVMNYIDSLASELVNGSTTPVTNSMANLAPLAENPAMRVYRKYPVLGSYLWPNPGNVSGRTKYWNGPNLAPTLYTAADAEVDAMKSFLVKRLAWIDDQNYSGSTIYRPPVFSLTGGSVPSGTTLSISRHTGTPPQNFTYASGGTLYYTTDESDPRSSSGTAQGTAYTGPLVLANSATVKARLLENGNWSPLTTASFIVNAVPASPANLVISELCYKPTPPAPGTPEYLAGYTSGNNFEYMELLNVSAGNVDLTGCQIIGGITFSFAGVSQSKLTLAPGERVLVVGNEAAFAMRHGTGQAARILGTFSGNLSNSGETVTLLGADTNVIASVAYGIADPWPLAPQTSGYSLVLTNARPNPTYGAADFRSSVQAGGTPGVSAGFSPVISLGDLLWTYDGNPHAASAVTDPAGLAVALTYNGSATPPTDAGSYALAATVSHFDYSGSANGTLVIGKAPATVTLGYLTAIYDGSAKPVSVSTDPAGLAVSLTYDGNPGAPANAGTYAVEAVVSDPNYEGTASGNLVISKASATVALGNLAQVYDGGDKPASVLTSPAGLGAVLTYNGVSTVPVNAGSYTVQALIEDPNYQGDASAELVVAKAVASVTLGNLAQTYDGSPKPASVTTTPSGLAVSLTYDGSASAPADLGSYAVVATVADANYTGNANGTLVISQPLFADWQSDNFTPAQVAAGASDPMADPDGDGHVNLMEYALGMDPNVRNPPVSAGVLADPQGADRLTMEFVRPVGLTDVQYAVEVSGDPASGWTPVGAVEISPIVNTQTERVVARDPVAVGSATVRFIRLKVIHSGG